MMGRMNRQMGFDDIGWRERIPRNSFWRKIHDWAEQNLFEEDFAPLFASTGRPSVSPVQTMLALLVQMETDYSDRQLEEASRYDERCKLALLAGRDFPGIDAVTLCGHRQLFFASGIGEQILEKTLVSAAEAGLMDDKRSIIDSFMIGGAAAVQDTFTLIRKGIVKMLYVLRCHEIELSTTFFRRDDYDQKGKPKINWDSTEEKQSLLESLVLDALDLVNVVRELSPLPTELDRMAELLETVATQDVTITDGRVKIVRGTAKDRVISVEDPEMRHGRKTSSKKSNGYKGHVLVTGTKGDIIQAVEVTPANSPDAEPLPSMLEKEEQKERRPEMVLGDTAYSDPEMVIDEAKKGTKVEAKVHPASNASGLYTKDKFILDLEKRTVTCPAQNTIEFPGRFLVNGTGGTVSFGIETCQACPLRAQCTTGKTGRAISIHPHEEHRQAAREYQKTPEFNESYSYRSHVERKIAHITRHGGRYARYIGQAKTRAQLICVAVLTNIKAVMRALRAGEICLASSN